MLTGQRVHVTKTIARDDPVRPSEMCGEIVAWMQGQGPYAIVRLDVGRFVTAAPEHLRIEGTDELK